MPEQKSIVTCYLCDTGFPLSGKNHIPTQRLGMIAVTRCRKQISRADVAFYRQHLNVEGGEYKHRNGRFIQKTRAYGDYLYKQDRDKFMVDLAEWLPTVKST